MKVLIDANVWLSAFVFGGVCRRMPHLVVPNCELVFNDAVAGEVAEKLEVRFELSREKCREVLSEMSLLAEWAITPPNIPAVCRDPDDDVHLATALAEGCSYLVTGDKDLLVLDPHENLRIENPREFLSLLEGGSI